MLQHGLIRRSSGVGSNPTLFSSFYAGSCSRATIGPHLKQPLRPLSRFLDHKSSTLTLVSCSLQSFTVYSSDNVFVPFHSMTSCDPFRACALVALLLAIIACTWRWQYSTNCPVPHWCLLKSRLYCHNCGWSCWSGCS